MSGGYFDYEQYKIDRIADQVEHLIETNDDKTLNEWGETKGRGYPSGVIAEFRKGLHYLRVAAVYAQRIDWLVSGDDGEDNFLDRLHRDLASAPLWLPQEAVSTKIKPASRCHVDNRDGIAILNGEGQ